MLRRALTVVLIGAFVAVGVPTPILAQDQLALGTVSGRAVDAVGRNVPAQRVELMDGTQVISVTKTSPIGEWSFRGIKPGDYVVRINIDGKLSGVRVTIAAGKLTSDALIVVSTASVSPQLGTVASLLTTLAPSVAVTATAAATAAGYETETTELNDEILEEILEEMTPAERVAFATAVLEAVKEAGASSSPFSQYVAELTTIVATQGTVVPDFPEPTPPPNNLS